MKPHGNSAGIGQSILNLDTRWARVVSFTPLANEVPTRIAQEAVWGTTAALDVSDKRKFSSSYQESNHCFWIVHLLQSAHNYAASVLLERFVIIQSVE
jgi:hypothetical protein